MTRQAGITIPADIGEIPKVSESLEVLMRDHAFSDEEILDTQLAVEEAVTNVILHGYENTTGEVSVTFLTTHGMLEVRIEDRAPAFDPLSMPEPDIESDVEDRKIGGLGVFLIRQVMDDVSYRYEDGKNILVMVKRKSG
jgi:serine/threonine-protein kinase RsbW